MMDMGGGTGRKSGGNLPEGAGGGEGWLEEGGKRHGFIGIHSRQDCFRERAILQDTFHIRQVLAVLQAILKMKHLPYGADLYLYMLDTYQVWKVLGKDCSVQYNSATAILKQSFPTSRCQLLPAS
jgi:hypothetical protein